MAGVDIGGNMAKPEVEHPALAERFLIEHYRPVWNTVVDGFGNHAPGRGRASMKRPRWDILHPGRPWAQKWKPAETAEQIIAELGA